MNFTLSLIIYNPLEAIVIILFLVSLSREEFKIKNLLSCFILGAVNLVLQYPNKFIQNEVLVFIYDVFVALVLMSFTSYFAYLLIFKKSISMYKCFLASVFNFVTIYIGIYTVQLLGITDIFFNVEQPLISEFLTNFTIKVIQFVLLIILNYGVNFIMKNLLKKLAMNNTEKAFTAMQHFQPKMPKALKAKIESKKSK